MAYVPLLRCKLTLAYASMIATRVNHKKIGSGSQNPDVVPCDCVVARAAIALAASPSFA